MKTLYLLIFTLLISATSIAQNGINYKALIKDGNGDAVVNTSIRMHFTIQYDPQNFIVTYSEDHVVSTDANGIVVLNIGEGNQTSVDDPFSEIPWDQEDYYLKVEVDISGGSNYTDLGTTQFMSVPYARHSETAAKSLDNYWRKNGNNIYTPAEKAGIRKINPEEALDVNGRIKIGDDLTVPTPTNPGVIRWNETTQDFEGYTGTAWVSLTKSSPSSGGWGSQSVTENKKISDDGGFAIAGFGYSIAISGNRAIIGSHNGNSPGVAYIYSNTGGTWTVEDIIQPNIGDDVNGNYFGSSVAISGDYAIVGASKIDDNGIESGAAYIFIRSGSNWFQQDKLLPLDGDANARFGNSVAISGDYAVVGANKDDENGAESGAAYIFNRSGNTWSQQDKITPSDGGAGFQFGNSVAISGDYALIGAYFDDENGAFAGAAYIFSRSGNTWSQQSKFNATTGSLFGQSVAIDVDYAIVGGSQAAYIINRSGNTWTLGDQLNPLDDVTGALFGGSVAISGDFAIVGASLDDNGGVTTGSAYIFSKSGSTWSQQAKLNASDSALNDRFGHSVAISNDFAIVGAPDNDESGPDFGAAYFFNN